ncbi:hypothetical protein MYCTH_54054 [Thermothelomyces thermophilus ATCC 42464]|uniref:OTU domain-containing protein n=1 Tax=Thermothelomyces thermophilus (strain ATCC 42464 / BCRC 31852 / DSM 1799) TaxID=573729 RepID=G2QI95_THET4|nr:uncharacterized protein MYCTH_54054 [Thermothelomyces thermophilus ATCC 42464]AEO60284.1 hypothetical protein MYCTH_54054 [Thermothelomyces thermophilus ATCC 42464]
MNSEALKAFLDQASEAEKDWLANALYYRELETIRREAPLLDPNKYASKKVDVYDSSAAPPGQAVTAAAATISHGPNLQGGAAPDRPPPQYLNRKSGIDIDQLPWLLARVLAKVSTVSLSEDDGEAGNNATPPSGPLSDTRLDIANIRQSIGYTKPFEEQFPDEIQAAKADFLSTGYKYVNQESIFNAPDWLGDLRKFEGRTALLKGFPMVEDVTFLKHPNYWQTIEEHGKLIEDGQCYWSSIGLLLYGNAHSWLRVKAEHLSFLERVLVNPNHPRHAFYSRENQNMGVTYATGPAGLDSQWSGQVNLWERLQIPGCWTNEDLCQLTADVYGVFLVLYKYDTANEANAQWKGKVYDMKTYGAYNNRHIFLCYYLENHFQPMVPNEYCASEFKLPRLTLSNTDRYELVSRKRTRKVRDGPGHHWRAQPQVVPSLAWPSFEAEHLARAAGYGPYVKKSLPRHMSPSHTGSTVLQAPKPEEEVWEEVVWEEGGKGKDKKNASPFANPEALKSPNVTREVVSLLSAETSGRGSSRGLTQADTLRAREALGVLHRYIDKVSGATAADSGRHPLPTGRPSLPAASHNNPQEDLKGKGKRPAIDPPESGPHPSKRPRTPPRAPAQPSTSSNFVSLTPTNRGHQGPSTANPQTHAGPSGTALPGPATFFRAASKTLLTKVRVARLKRWCLDLELAAGDDVAAWRKERCVRELLAAGVQVRLVRAAAGAVVVDEEVEDRGVEVVRVAPAAPVAITGGGAAAAAGEGDGDVDQGQGNAGDDEDGDGDGDNGDGDE